MRLAAGGRKAVRRPLDEEQLRYAALDAEVLLRVRDRLVASVQGL